jgi:hypothetical protein
MQGHFFRYLRRPGLFPIAPCLACDETCRIMTPYSCYLGVPVVSKRLRLSKPPKGAT